VPKIGLFGIHICVFLKSTCTFSPASGDFALPLEPSGGLLFPSFPTCLLLQIPGYAPVGADTLYEEYLYTTAKLGPAKLGHRGLT